MKTIGLIHDPEMDESTRKLIAEKRAAYEAATNPKKSAPAAEASAEPTNANGFPPGATLCAKYNTQALVLMDGC